MILADFHTHTNFSTDSDSSPESMIERAISLGLTTYCITDHMDYRFPHGEEGTFTFSPDDYITCLQELKKRYANQIELLIGVELGLRNEPEQKEEMREYYNSLLSTYPFDFVIGSTHVLQNTDPYYKEFWITNTTKEGILAYFESIAHNAKYYRGFQTYGHLDYIIRYIPETLKVYDYLDYKDILDECLRTLIEHGIGIECNTSGYKYKLSNPHPKVEILKRYLELGGEILTIGSDAHKPEHIAYDFTVANDLLTNLGFRYYTVFRDRKPTFMKL